MTDFEIKTEISPADEEDLAQQKSSSSSAENPNHDQQQQEEDETNQFVKPKLPNFPHTAASTTVKREEEVSTKVEDGDNKSQVVQQQQLLPESGIELRYTEPDWARIPTTSGGQNAYFLEVIKNGSVIEHFSLHSDREKEIAKSYLAIGRFDPCDIKLEHPSVSRFHAVLQYGELVRGRPQWFLFDMNSTHGVRLNKRPIQKSTFVPLTVGHVFQIAGSSRLFVLSGGPDEEMDVDESEGSKQPTTKIEMSADEAEKDGKSGDDKNAKKEAASAADGEELKDGEGGEEERHAFYVKDPLYWLERYFEREGSQMNFKFTKTVGEGVDLFGGLGLEEGGSKKKRARGGAGDDGSNWICSIELVSDVSLSRGTMVTASAPSRRLAQQQCALLACERLDEACLLQISSLWNKRKTYAENDFYEEDEDVFFDRTGQLEEQREKRKRRYEGDPADSNRAKTYDDLLKDLADVDTKLGVIGSEIQRLMGSNKYAEQQQQQAGDGAAENKPAMNFSMRMAISQMKSKEKKLLEEKHRLTRLAAIAKPSRPQFIPKSSAIKKEKVEEKRRLMPLGPAMKEETEHGKEEEKGMEEKDMEDEEENPAIEEEGSQKKKEDSTKSEETVKKVLDKYLPTNMPTNASATAPPKNAASAMAEQQRRMVEEKASQQKPPPSSSRSEAIPSPAEDEQLGKDEAETEERFYAPAMPSRAQAQAIAPKFGMLTKEEMVQMKLWQRQRDEETEEARRAKLHQQERAQQMQEEEPAFDVTEKYATWLPPDDQSGDGSTRLNKKFAGKY